MTTTASIRSLALALAFIAAPFLAVAAETAQSPGHQHQHMTATACGCSHRDAAPASTKEGPKSEKESPKWDPMVDSVKP